MKDKSRIRIFLGIIFLIFIASLLIMQIYNSDFKSLSNGKAILDMRFHYNSDDTYELMDALGDQGKALYKKILLADFIFIISFAVIQSYITRFLLEKFRRTQLKFLLLLPYLRGISDIIEDIFILLILNHPLSTVKLVSFSAIFTKLKFILLAIWIVWIVVLVFIKLKKP